MNKVEYDYIVIGAGSAGIASVNRAASYGAKCAVIEAKIIGGTCVNVGCVPKKIMWEAANITDIIENYTEGYGIDAEIKEFNFEKLVEARDKYISNIHNSYAKTFNKNKVDIIHGSAKFIKSSSEYCEIDVNGTIYVAPHILIATGSRPMIPNVLGAQYGIDSNEFFELDKLPERVAIIGAGYIAVEFAGILNSLGVKTELLVRNDYPLRTFDSMISRAAAHNLKNHNVDVHSFAVVDHIEKSKNTEQNEYFIYLQDGRVIDTDLVIWATGRRPNNDKINLGLTGVVVDDNGYIKVDKYQNTSVPGIYALGDNTDTVHLTPVAVAAGRKLADRLFNHQADAYLDTALVPTVVFSHPPIGSIGLNEQQAIETYGEENIKIYESKFVPLVSAVTPYKEEFKIKMICLSENNKIIGLHGVGIHMDEIIQGFSVAIKMGATKEDFDNTIAIHPTISEEFVTLTESNLRTLK